MNVDFGGRRAVQIALVHPQNQMPVHRPRVVPKLRLG